MKIIYSGSLAEGRLFDAVRDHEYDFKRGIPLEVHPNFAPVAMLNPDWKQAAEDKPTVTPK